MRSGKTILFATVCALCLMGCSESAPAETTPLAEPSTPQVETTAPVMVTEPAAQTTMPADTEPQEERFTLTFAGDCTLGANPVNTYAEVGFPRVVGEDYAYPMRNAVSFFASDDATFVNLEGALTETGNPADKTHTFRGPSAYSHILTDNSIEVVTLANNHSLDYGQTGWHGLPGKSDHHSLLDQLRRKDQQLPAHTHGSGFPGIRPGSEQAGWFF